MSDEGDVALRSPPLSPLTATTLPPPHSSSRHTAFRGREPKLDESLEGTMSKTNTANTFMSPWLSGNTHTHLHSLAAAAVSPLHTQHLALP